MKYIPVKGQKKYCDMMRKLSGANDPNANLPDYLEATVYSKVWRVVAFQLVDNKLIILSLWQDEAVIMVGNFSDVTTSEQKAKINHVTTWYKPWFYKHVETFLNKVSFTLIITLFLNFFVFALTLEN